jgi:flavin reductase (DIM6/NTAB) family NADH-FMN oxidoreductase RutF
MEKVEITKEAVLYPMPCSIVGAMVEGKTNYVTVAWFTMVNLNPPYIGIALNKIHHTNHGIKESGFFSVNIPSADMLEKTDYCGIVSGRKFDKAAQFETFYGKSGAPMIKECPYNIDCVLVHTMDLPTQDFFIGEIKAVFSDDRFLSDGVPDITKINPLVLAMPNRMYHSVGAPIAEAWGSGKTLIKR